MRRIWGTNTLPILISQYTILYTVRPVLIVYCQLAPLYAVHPTNYMLSVPPHICCLSPHFMMFVLHYMLSVPPLYVVSSPTIYCPSPLLYDVHLPTICCPSPHYILSVPPLYAIHPPLYAVRPPTIHCLSLLTALICCASIFGTPPSSPPHTVQSYR